MKRYGKYLQTGLIISCATLFLLSPLFVNTSILNLLMKIMIFSLLTMSLDLQVGYTGLWSFGHSSLFGVSAYTTAILITKYGFTSFWATAPLSIVTAILVSALFGYVALRVSGIYFLLVTLALGEVVYHTAVRWTDLFGGSNGIFGIPYPGFCSSPFCYFYFVSVVFAVLAGFLYLITKSPFGYSLKGIRENRARMDCLGYNVWLRQYGTFILSGTTAGVAGVLYVHFNGLISPSSVGLDATGLLWLMLLCGGPGTLWGSIIGSILILTIQYFVSSISPLRWPLIMGMFFVAAVMSAKSGIYPEMQKILEKILGKNVQ